MIDFIGRFYRRQRAAGVRMPRILGRVPRKVVGTLWEDYRARQAHDVINGFGRFDLPLLAAYSRSGTNWVRYILETLSGRPTPGQARVHTGGDYLLDRAHRAYPKMGRYPRVVLVLRDYRECLLRHHPRLWAETGKVDAFLNASMVPQPPRWYVRNLAAFDGFDGPKLRLYYEDLTDDPAPSIRQLAGFFTLGPAATDAFLADLDAHRAASAHAYWRGGHRLDSVGIRDPHHHARQHLTDAQARGFDAYYRRHHPALFDAYLRRYVFPG